MKPTARWLPWIFSVLLALACIGSLIQYARWVIAPTTHEPIGQDANTAFERRLTAIRQDLPASGVVGYLADWDLPNVKSTSGHEAEYILVQYSLAPLVLQRGVKGEWGVGNFKEGLSQSQADALQVSIVKTYPYGFYLLRKK